MIIVSYCNGTWPSIGGVARYDTQLKLIFPNRIFFKGPQEKDKMLQYLKTCKEPIIITDNHLSCDIPNEYPVLLVHHGCALTTSERNPDWEPFWRDLCCNGQKQMLSYRNPQNTWIISISNACAVDFNRFYPDLYPKFKRIDLLHPSELYEGVQKKGFNDKPIILGNWNHIKKGKHLLPKLKELLPEFEFIQLNVMPKNNESLGHFNYRKQDIYIKADMFLQIANSEGYSYASNDSLINGLVTIATNVGGFFGDVYKDAYVELDWKKCYGENIDYDYICDKIRYAWDNREELSKKGREWYMKNCRFTDWEKKMKDLVTDFHSAIYNK
jgi:glycosyltransferase involved in cell wall biosynthesis